MKNKKIMLSILGILIVLLSVIGITYAYYSAKIKEVNKTETIIKTNELGLTFTGVSEINVNNMIPGDSFTKTFSVENTSNVSVSYNIYMENITNEFNEDLVYTLSDEDGEVVAETVLPVTNTEKSYLKTNVEIEAGVTKNYSLKIELKYLDIPQNDNQGKTFKTTLGIDANQIENQNPVVKVCSVTTGTGQNIGDIISCGSESFYVISNDGTNIKMLSQYNVDPTSNVQSSTASGISHNDVNVYEDSNAYTYTNNYRNTLETIGINVVSISAISYDELDLLGCGYDDNYSFYTCTSSTYSWIYSTRYFTSIPGKSGVDLCVISSYNGYIITDSSDGDGYDTKYGVRPVVTISANEI